MAYGASASTVLTLLGFCVCVIFIVFVCTRFACAIAKRRRRRQRRASPLPQYTVSPYVFPLQLLVGRHAGGASGAGLDSAAVAAFPTRAFACGPRDSSASPSSADAQCVICLEEYKDKDMMRYLPYCSHNFHIACIDVWLEQNSTCPICRISLRGNPDYTHRTPPPLSVAISPPCSPQESGSDPCRCLFVSTGHSSRASEVFSHEPDQENQLASGPSVDGATNNLPLPEAISPHEDNNQTVRKQVCRSSQLEPGK